MTASMELAPEIPIDDVIVRDRVRKDYGDLGDLVESIRNLGVLQPIALTAGNELIFGARRLEASRRAGLDRVPYFRPQSLPDARSRLEAERDENTCRKEMTFSEQMEFGALLEAFKEPEARARQLEGQRLGGQLRQADSALDRSRSKADRGPRVADEIAPALGIGRTQYFQGKHIIAAAADTSETEEVQDAAKKAIADLDAGKTTVNGAYQRVAKARKPAVKSATPAKPPSYGPRRRHLEVLTNAATSLSGLLIILDEISDIDASVGNEEAARLKGGFSKAITGLNRISNLLKERIA